MTPRVLAPLVEELFFRGACYGRLARSGPPAAALLEVRLGPLLASWLAAALLLVLLLRLANNPGAARARAEDRA
ncbi:MAG TPA: CPBP family intramembrane glutamic endopeptidase [Polyangiaceae bacterium]|nr:CPBP family intramembrane glutamic endopeptidase [Polyangiaceae bacterium]